MRHNLPHFSIGDNVPACPNCGTPGEFTQAGDLKDGRLYLIFKCMACDAGEFKIWRPEWQAMKDLLLEDD